MRYWPSLEAQLEHDINQWVKDTVESTLGRVGTVEAMAMDEFFQKMRAVFREITASDSLSRASISLPAVGSVGAPSLGASLPVPSDFGEGVSVSVCCDLVKQSSVSGCTPGKNLFRL